MKLIDTKLIVKIVLYILESILLFILFYYGMLGLKTSVEKEDYANLERAIRKASVECYAIEGMYPPDIEYLETHYGIQIDKEKYHVFYEGFASNMLPDITIVSLGDGK